ncbi:MAG: sigma-70 family RNA polymerase sigma factor [Acidobacteria bacterium]|nr:sigma-70 family RNA polymerase sigma factor [Acidobacteriota bacterium]
MQRGNSFDPPQPFRYSCSRVNDQAQAQRPTLDGTSIGDEAADVVFPRLYEELRRLAASALRRERAGHTLQPTALVHEAFLRLANSADVPWDSRDHFVAIAGRVMRQVLVDHARRKHAAKRSTGAVRVPLDDVDVPAATVDVDLVALDAAIVKLATFDPRQARIVELRFFAGLSVPETAALIGASERTVKRDWQIARAWLTRELSYGEPA